MKILYHHRIQSKDGQSVHIDELVCALRAGGHTVEVVGPQRFADAPFGHDPKFLAAMKRLVPKVLYEVLEIGYNIPAYFRLRRAFKRLKPDLLYERCNLNLLAGAWLKKRTGVKMLLEVNAPLARERETHDGIGLKRMTRQLERFVWRSADFVLPVTDVLADEMRAAGVVPQKIVVVPNAIDPARFSNGLDYETAKSELKLAGKTVLGFTGFVRNWHGLDAIIDWLSRPETPQHMNFVVIGEGPALPALKAKVASLRIQDRVHFMGLVNRDKIARMVAAFDVALQPKCVEYASPLKLFEYMAMGKAIVAPDQPNIREVLTNGATALLFDPKRPESLIAAIKRLCDEPGLRKRLGMEAHRTIELRGFTWTANALRVATLAQAVSPIHRK